MKHVFTTGEAARLCRLSQSTIIRCFDSGQLKGFYVPGSRFRRIAREELLRFMRDNGIPTNQLDAGPRRLLLVDHETARRDEIGMLFRRDQRFEVHVARDSFDAGLLVQELLPQAVLVAFPLPDGDTVTICQQIRQNPTFAGAQIVCFSAGPLDAATGELRSAGADRLLPRLTEPAALWQVACDSLGLETRLA
jgi:excisionase family DNA binding protein